MKILLLGDASHFHATLAKAISALGHEVTVASAGSGWMMTPRDIDLARYQRGKTGGGVLKLRLDTVLRSRLRGNDVVQLCDTSFIRLRPKRQLALVEKLRRHNGLISFCFLGDNPFYITDLTSSSPSLAYSEWQSPWGESTGSNLRKWLSPEMVDYSRRLLDNVDCVNTALYEYQQVAEKAFSPRLPVSYTGIPIDLEGLPQPESHDPSKPLKILFAVHRGREALKGADILLPMLRRLQCDRPGKVEVLTPENVPYGQFLNLLGDVDIVCDQLYSYTPATTALLAMARGAVTISGAETDYLRFIGHPEDMPVPVFNPDPRDLPGTYARLLALVDDRDRLNAMRAAAPEFVRRNNDSLLVARRSLDTWQRVLTSKKH